LRKNKGKEKKNGKDEFLEFVSSAIRAPRAGAYEHLLSQFLAQAVICTDPLKRVKVVCEAALMIPESERKSLAIDYETVQVLNHLANAFLNRSTHKIEEVEVVSIPWGFPLTEKNFEKFIKPWLKCKFPFYPFLLRNHTETWKVWTCRKCKTVLAEKQLPVLKEPKIPSKCPGCGTKLTNWWDWDSYEELRVKENPLWSFFFDASNCLSLEGYNTLKNAFAAWAIPKVQLYLAELTRVVSPGLYREILGLYTKRTRKGYAEKVKEIAEVPGKDEDSLGAGF